MLVSIGIMALLASLLLPAIGKGLGRSKLILCMSNSKNIANAWLLYSSDNRDVLPPIGDGLNTVTNWIAGNMTRPSEYTNVSLLTNRGVSLAASYIPVVKIWRCSLERTRNVRSYSFNYRMNPFRSTGNPRWLEGEHAKYSTFVRFSDIDDAATRLVAIEESAESINDAYFVVDSSDTGDPNGIGSTSGSFFVDYPARLHDSGAIMAFADLHVERRKWLTKEIETPLEGAVPKPVPKGNLDVQYLKSISTRRKRD